MGCGFGGLVVRLAPLYPDKLVLGMELRDKVTGGWLGGTPFRFSFLLPSALVFYLRVRLSKQWKAA